MRLNKYLGCISSFEAYPQIGNMISDNDLSLNLFFVPTVYHVVTILNDKKSERTN